MAQAMIAGLLAKKVLTSRQIAGFDVNPTQLARVRKKFGLRTCRSLRELAATSDIILLSVKPQDIRKVLVDIAGYVVHRHLVISIAAGIDVATLEWSLGKKQKIIRVMPNMPALIGQGASTFYLNSACGPRERKVALKIFSAVGEVAQVKNEKLLDAVTGLSGSGPAFVFTFIEGLIAGGKKSGLTPEMSRKLALQTVIGAAILAQQSSETPQQLTAKVASKGGTTEAGLKVLKRKKFVDTVANCVSAATRRARQLRS